jgi:hypothetical protein
MAKASSMSHPERGFTVPSPLRGKARACPGLDPGDAGAAIPLPAAPPTLILPLRGGGNRSGRKPVAKATLVSPEKGERGIFNSPLECSGAT